jgi:hypothetical protein
MEAKPVLCDFEIVRQEGITSSLAVGTYSRAITVFTGWLILIEMDACTSAEAFLAFPAAMTC